MALVAPQHGAERGSTSRITVADLVQRCTAPHDGPVPDPVDPERTAPVPAVSPDPPWNPPTHPVSVGALLRREGRGRRSADPPLKPRRPTPRRPGPDGGFAAGLAAGLTTRKVAATAGALFAASAVMGTSVLGEVALTGPAEQDDDAPAADPAAPPGGGARVPAPVAAAPVPDAPDPVTGAADDPPVSGQVIAAELLSFSGGRDDAGGSADAADAAGTDDRAGTDGGEPDDRPAAATAARDIPAPRRPVDDLPPRSVEEPGTSRTSGATGAAAPAPEPADGEASASRDDPGTGSAGDADGSPVGADDGDRPDGDRDLDGDGGTDGRPGPGFLDGRAPTPPPDRDGGPAEGSGGSAGGSADGSGGSADGSGGSAGGSGSSSDEGPDDDPGPDGERDDRTDRDGRDGRDDGNRDRDDRDRDTRADHDRDRDDSDRDRDRSDGSVSSR